MPPAPAACRSAPLPLPARPRPAAANRASPRPPQAAREAARTGQPADGAFVSAGLGVSQPSAEETQTPRLGTRAAQCVRPARLLRATSRLQSARLPPAASPALTVPVAVLCRYADGLRGKALLYSGADSRKAVEAAQDAKEVLLGTFGNFTTVRRRVLQWWSDVSETDADFMPELNSRVVLVCGGADEISPVQAAADRYLAAAFAYQFVQAAEVDLAVEGGTREAVAGAVSEAATGAEGWAKTSGEWRTQLASEGVDVDSLDLMLGFDVFSGTLPVYWKHTDELSDDNRTHTRMPDAMKFDMGGSINRWANEDQRTANTSRPLDTTWGARDAEPDDSLGDVGAARKRGELPRPRL